MVPVIMILAVGPNNVISFKNKLPWHSKKGLHYFKEQTTGYPCIFGKTTFNG